TRPKAARSRNDARASPRWSALRYAEIEREHAACDPRRVLRATATLQEDGQGELRLVERRVAGEPAVRWRPTRRVRRAPLRAAGLASGGEVTQVRLPRAAGEVCAVLGPADQHTVP